MKDVIKLGLGLSVGVSAILISRYHPPTVEAINEVRDIIDSIIWQDMRELFQKWTLPAASIAAWIIWQKKRDEKIKTKRWFDLNSLNHGKKFSITTLDIPEDGRLYIENESEEHINNMFSKQWEIIDAIMQAASKLDYNDGSGNMIIKLDDQMGKLIYSKLRDNPKIFPEDKVLKITERAHGIKKVSTEFVAVLTKTPRYKILEDGCIQIVEENDKDADSAEKIRLMTVRRELIDKTLKWCEQQEQDSRYVCQHDILNWLCKDTQWNDPCVDRYIRYMLQDNEYYEGEKTDVNKLLKNPLYRIYMISIAQMAKHIKDGGGKIKIIKEIQANTAIINDNQPLTIKERLANQKTTPRLIRRDLRDIQ